MEDSEEVAPDIDIYDASNFLAVVEYIDGIYSFYRRTEDLSCVSPNYMSLQTDINEKMRGILIDWLIELVGVTAMLLTCKYEGVSVPIVEDLILICDRAYTRERMIVDTLEFNMSVPSSNSILLHEKLELLSFFIIELNLVNYEMLKFCSSMLAAAAIYTAQCTMNGFKSWNKCYELHTKYSEEQLMDCSRIIVELSTRA